ncbi:protein of unknown function [Caballeronia sp. S22]
MPAILLELAEKILYVSETAGFYFRASEFKNYEQCHCLFIGFHDSLLLDTALKAIANTNQLRAKLVPFGPRSFLRYAAKLCNPYLECVLRPFSFRRIESFC